MLQQHQAVSNHDSKHRAGSLTVSLARDANEIREAQRLRYKVFAEELGARLSEREPGIDSDIYDPFCEHLIVREPLAGRVVGTYRILNGANARRLGGFYSDEEFDLTRLDHLRDQIVEVGRTCVHRDFRNGAVISMLWAGVIQYAARHGYRYLFGCSSVSMADGGATASNVHYALQHRCGSPVEYRVFPRLDLPLRRARPTEAVLIPPLLKGYVRLGAYMCGAPAWDPDFNTADLLMLLPMSRLPLRYTRHILGRA
ncbi:MAG: GNAT family N-acyltransferase [Burkholderiales bacterium]